MAKPERFETSLQRLEKIVTRLEEGNLTLEESLKAYEEGRRLTRGCEERLNEVKKKIEILSKEKHDPKIS